MNTMTLTWTKQNETTDGRFYIVRRVHAVQLYDRRNALAGGVFCDDVREAKRLAERIAADDMLTVVIRANQTVFGVTYFEPTRVSFSATFARHLVARGIADAS